MKKWAAKDPGTPDDEKPPFLDKLGQKTCPRKKKLDPQAPLIKNAILPTKNRPQKIKKWPQDGNGPKIESKNEFFTKMAPKNSKKSPSYHLGALTEKCGPKCFKKKFPSKCCC